MRLTNLIFGRLELGAPWGLRLPDGGVARFYVVARGGTQLEIPGGPSVFLSAGDVALMPKGEAHTLRDAPGSAVVEVDDSKCQRHAATGDARRFGGDGATTTIVAGAFRFVSGQQTALLERLPAVIHIAGNDPASAPWLPATVHLMIAESVSRHPGASVVMSRLADILLVQALRMQQKEGCPGLRGLKDPGIVNALSLIHGRPSEEWTVENLAKSAGLSRSGFAARFAEMVGEPPLQYLTRWRMKKAAQYLNEQNNTVAAVAESVGYLSEASFNRAFKRWEGTTPAAFRRASRSA